MLLLLLGCTPTQERADHVAVSVATVVLEIFATIAADIRDHGEPTETAGTWTASPFDDGHDWRGSATVTLAEGGEPGDLCGDDPCASDTFGLTVDMDARVLNSHGSCGSAAFEPLDLDGALAGTMAFLELPVESTHGTSYDIVADLAGTVADGAGDLDTHLRLFLRAWTFYRADGTVGGRDISHYCDFPS